MPVSVKQEDDAGSSTRDAHDAATDDDDLATALALSLSRLDVNDRNQVSSKDLKDVRRIVAEASLRGDVASDQLELLDPTPDIHLLFQLFDRRWFQGRLCASKQVFLRWSTRLKLGAGMTMCERVRLASGSEVGTSVILLSTPLLSLRPRKDLIETLIHEMIHAYLFLTNQMDDGEMSHGPKFMKIMKRINQEGGCSISVFHDFVDEVIHLRKHVWSCDADDCGVYVRRMMDRPPSDKEAWFRQHASVCSGILRKVPADDAKEAVKKLTDESTIQVTSTVFRKIKSMPDVGKAVAAEPKTVNHHERM